MSKNKEEKQQPKFNRKKQPKTNKGDGLEEYVSDNPNFETNERKEKNNE